MTHDHAGSATNDSIRRDDTGPGVDPPTRTGRRTPAAAAVAKDLSAFPVCGSIRPSASQRSLAQR
jgi:hypothetical protein